MTHPIVEMWRKDADGMHVGDEYLVARDATRNRDADTLESLFTTVYTSPPSIEAFRAHAAVHGFDRHDERYGWLRVKSYSGWVQASCRVVDPATWEGWRGDKTPYVLCELYQGGRGGTVHSVSFDHGVIEWQWCDSLGHVCPPPEVK